MNVINMHSEKVKIMRAVLFISKLTDTTKEWIYSDIKYFSRVSYDSTVSVTTDIPSIWILLPYNTFLSSGSKECKVCWSRPVTCTVRSTKFFISKGRCQQCAGKWGLCTRLYGIWEKPVKVIVSHKNALSVFGQEGLHTACYLTVCDKDCLHSCYFQNNLLFYLF